MFHYLYAISEHFKTKSFIVNIIIGLRRFKKSNCQKMSLVSRRSDTQINLRVQSGFRNFFDRFRIIFCSCFQKQEENVLPTVQAVDSVRLVYMRRIEEASFLNVRSRQNEEIADGINQGTQTRKTMRHRRMKQQVSTLKALEKALKEYESKHRNILSVTRVPESISFDKTYQISRGSQTDTAEVIEELLRAAVHRINIKESINNSEVIKHVTLYNSEDEVAKSSEQKEEVNTNINNKELKDGMDSSKSTLQTI